MKEYELTSREIKAEIESQPGRKYNQPCTVSPRDSIISKATVAKVLRIQSFQGEQLREVFRKLFYPQTTGAVAMGTNYDTDIEKHIGMIEALIQPLIDRARQEAILETSILCKGEIDKAKREERERIYDWGLETCDLHANNSIPLRKKSDCPKCWHSLHGQSLSKKKDSGLDKLLKERGLRNLKRLRPKLSKEKE